MTPRTWLWILAPLALSAGVLWLSAQEAKAAPEGIRVSDLAEKVSAREKASAAFLEETRMTPWWFLPARSSISRGDRRSTGMPLLRASSMISLMMPPDTLSATMSRDFFGALGRYSSTGLRPGISFFSSTGYRPFRLPE